MPATTEIEVFNFEGNLEKGFADWFAANLTSSMRLSGFGLAFVNGDYPDAGELNGKRKFANIGIGQCVQWDGAQWVIFDDLGQTGYFSAEDVATPDLVTTWTQSNNGVLPIGTITKLSIDLFTANSIEVLPDSYIAPTVSINGATGKTIQKPSGDNEYSQYTFDVAFRIETERGEVVDSQTAEIATRHAEVVATCRRWLAVSNARGNIDSYFPLYQIDTLTPASSERDVSDDDDSDVTILNYSGQFTILTTAFPA